MGLVIRACRRKRCSNVWLLLSHVGKCICRSSVDSGLNLSEWVRKCHALSPALTNGWSRIAHKQAGEKCLGLIVFKENQRCVLVGSLERLVSKDVHRWLIGQV